jgi:DNA-directed RNA polymerase III subunit RPC4
MMKSGKVKIVFGEDVVMNVSVSLCTAHNPAIRASARSHSLAQVNSGVPATFLQQLVHLDAPTKSTTVLGEINKHFVVTPDVDRLLQELYSSGGVTPGDREAEQRKRALAMGVKLEPGLMRMGD